ncbi:hypothetical protein FCJ61_30935 [Burkholderia metallica]|uniref:hypothetical protein n=1 Tax=Burkholderia metallica TaxID=488729 RepID=UPI00157A76B0|nr:hypothetical protein [Burkholderia metallica]NTZ87282.1 hypothetical protein [Burkholderia metallica]
MSQPYDSGNPDARREIQRMHSVRIAAAAGATPPSTDLIDMLLPERARDELKQAAALGIEAIEQVTARLRVDYPSAFHTKDSLDERQFREAPMIQEKPRKKSEYPNRVRNDGTS